ncbi:MAG: histidine phosphatase family protein [Xanthobacteraceae bacterium]|nr:histidine phosphatase family protein [Xanthobacteraceae bacterium]
MRLVIAPLILAIAALPAAAADDPAALWAALRDGDRVALVRHAEAPGGAGDPPGFRLGVCATQRNLSKQGRAEARALGDRFRAEKIAVAKVLTSRWCRARDTARLMKIGRAEAARTFDYAYAPFNRGRVDELTEGARAVVAAWKGPGALVVVTHGSNINSLTGVDPGEGGIMVVEPDPASEARLRVLGRIASGR